MSATRGEGAVSFVRGGLALGSGAVSLSLHPSCDKHSEAQRCPSTCLTDGVFIPVPFCFNKLGGEGEPSSACLAYYSDYSLGGGPHRSTTASLHGLTGREGLQAQLAPVLTTASTHGFAQFFLTDKTSSAISFRLKATGYSQVKPEPGEQQPA